MAAPISGEPSNEEILNAIDVLKRAGLNISIAPGYAGSTISAKDGSGSEGVSELRGKQAVNPTEYINSDYETMRMMLGNGNNNNNDPMMNMLPYMLNANNDGKNIDPQVIQTLMMNSMMSGISGLNTTDSNK